MIVLKQTICWTIWLDVMSFLYFFKKPCGYAKYQYINMWTKQLDAIKTKICGLRYWNIFIYIKNAVDKALVDAPTYSNEEPYEDIYVMKVLKGKRKELKWN